MTDKPSVPFACVHNAGRARTAAGFLTRLAAEACDACTPGGAA